MHIDLQLTYNDGNTKLIRAAAADLVAFESKFDISVARLEQNVKLTHLLFLAWHSEKRTKSTGLEFEEWLDSIETIEASEPKK
jgi:hypothetical protein